MVCSTRLVVKRLVLMRGPPVNPLVASHTSRHPLLQAPSPRTHSTSTLAHPCRHAIESSPAAGCQHECNQKAHALQADTTTPPAPLVCRAWSGVSIRNLWDPWSYWGAVLYLAAVAIPAQAAIHAYSNAFLSSVYGSLTVHKHRLVASRGIALALNGAAIALASQHLNVLGVTIIASMISATLCFPVFLSICSRYFYKRATGAIIIASSVAGLVGCFVYAVLHVRGWVPYPDELAELSLVCAHSVATLGQAGLAGT
jgi:hypothetical protein